MIRISCRREVALLAFTVPWACGGAAAAATASAAPKETTVRVISMRADGQISVAFHGASPGCTALAACSTSGVVVATPASDQQATFGLPGGQGNPGVGLGSSGDGETAARVAVGSGRSCTDSASEGVSFEQIGTGSRARLKPLFPSIQSRCAGPLDADVATALPTAPFADPARSRVGRRIVFAATRAFRSHGFAGTVRVAITLRVDSVRDQAYPVDPSTVPTAPRPRRLRLATLTFSVSASGGVRSTFSGDPDPTVCGGLGSCGATGIDGLSFGRRAASAALYAIGPANRPLRDFRAALGLQRGGHAAGISLLGGLFWRTQSILTESFNGCADTVAAPIPIAIAPFRGRLVLVGLGIPSRTRCAGPMIDSIGLAPSSAGIGLRALARLQSTVTFAQSHTFADDGYTGTTSVKLRLAFRRTGFSSVVGAFPGTLTNVLGVGAGTQSGSFSGSFF